MSQRGHYVVEEPYRQHFAITLDADISPPADAIWTNAAGDVSVRLENGTDLVYTLTASSGINLGAVRINTTGTTISASALRGLRR